jgi:hypothetical protein
MMLLAGGLYLGPFLAGLARLPVGAVPVFGALLALWSIMYQSGSWRRRAGEPALLVSAKVLLLGCAMLVLAGICFLAGAGLSFITGVVPLPPAVPLAIPITSLVLAVLLQSPRKAAEMDVFLDDALVQLQGLGTPRNEPGQMATAERLARRIGALPDDATAEDVLAVLEGSAELDAALLAAVDRMGVPPPRPARLAAVLLVTDLERGSALAGRGEAAWVFDVARGDPDLEALFASRAIALLAERPEMCSDMPYAYDVDQARATASRAETAQLLGALRDRLSDLSTQDG